MGINKGSTILSTVLRFVDDHLDWILTLAFNLDDTLFNLVCEGFIQIFDVIVVINGLRFKLTSLSLKGISVNQK